MPCWVPTALAEWQAGDLLVAGPEVNSVASWECPGCSSGRGGGHCPPSPAVCMLRKGPRASGSCSGGERALAVALGEWEPCWERVGRAGRGVGTTSVCIRTQCTQVVATGLNPSPGPPSSSTMCPGVQSPSVHTVAWAGTGGQGGRSHGDVCVPGQFLWEVDPGLPAERDQDLGWGPLVAVA